VRCWGVSTKHAPSLAVAFAPIEAGWAGGLRASGKGALICAISSLRRAIQIALSLGSSGSLLARQTRAHEFAKRSDDHWASALQENNIAPLTIELPDPLLDADAAKAAAFVEPEACFVLGEDSGLRRGGGGGEGVGRAVLLALLESADAAGIGTVHRPRPRRHRRRPTVSRRLGGPPSPGSLPPRWPPGDARQLPSLQPSHVGNAVSSVASRVSMPSW
jgi:hypothetical protein